MKTVIKILVVVLTSISLSCNKDDDNNSTSGSVVGKWAFTKAAGIVNGQEVDEEPWDNFANCPDFLEFKSDGQFTQGTYTNSSCALSSAEGTWAQEGNTIKISGGDFAVYEVVSVTNTQLKVKFKNPFIIDEYEDMFYLEKVN
jgi:hypothetical protein